MAINWTEIKDEYEATQVTLKTLAEKYGIKIGTLKSRKSREGWTRVASKKVAREKKVATPKPIIVSEELTERQKLFCLYYIKYYNATKAYLKAYGCDYRTAGTNGSRLLGNACVKKEIERLKNEQQQGLFLDGMAVLQKYIDIAFADITDYVEFGEREYPAVNLLTGEPVIDENGEQVMRNETYFEVKNSSDIDGSLLTEIKQTKYGIAFKLADKLKALEVLTKYFDLIPETFKRRIEEERLSLHKQKQELDKRIVEMREREEQMKGW